MSTVTTTTTPAPVIPADELRLADDIVRNDDVWICYIDPETGERRTVRTDAQSGICAIASIVIHVWDQGDPNFGDPDAEPLATISLRSIVAADVIRVDPDKPRRELRDDETAARWLRCYPGGGSLLRYPPLT